MSSLANLEALFALADAGTMTRAATRLRITQSAVSKRVAALEDELGVELVEPDGRGVRLTASGLRLLDRAGPLVAELRGALSAETIAGGGRLVIGVSESILASWGPPLLAGARAALPQTELAVHAHRSPVVLERVRAGEYMIGLVAGATTAPDLTVLPLVDEPMVLVARGRERLRVVRGTAIGVLTIEAGSATWKALSRQLVRLRRDRDIEVRVERTVESFSCAVQMARAGFAHALVPVGIARALGVPRARIATLRGVTRPVSLVGRPMTLARPLAAAFCAELRARPIDTLRWPLSSSRT